MVPALAQKRCGAENGRGKQKLITISPAWKGNAGQAVRIKLAGLRVRSGIFNTGTFKKVASDSLKTLVTRPGLLLH